MSTPEHLSPEHLPSEQQLAAWASDLYRSPAAASGQSTSVGPPPVPGTSRAASPAWLSHAGPSSAAVSPTTVPLAGVGTAATVPGAGAVPSAEAVPSTAAADASSPALDALAALALTQPPDFAFPLVPQDVDAAPAQWTDFSPRVPLPHDAGVQAFNPALVPDLPAERTAFDPHLARRDFPLLTTHVHGRPLIWLDNAATTQKPQAVIDRLVRFYEHENSNIHRAAHTLAARATDAYEGARESVRRYLNAPSADQIIFVRGTTEGINLVAKSWGRANVSEGDEILITHLEHHANIVPWQQLAEATGAVLRVAPVDDRGDIIVDAFAALITPRTRIAAITQVSNALGTVTPAAELIGIAHAAGVPVLLDAAQSVAHARVDVQHLQPDFLVLSGHKIYGPTGIGALYATPEMLAAMPPWEGGGNMIADVTFERTTYNPPPARFEAGTGNIADAVGLGAALDYVSAWGIDAVAAYEHELMDYLVGCLDTVPGLSMLGAPTHRAGAVSFTLAGYDNTEVGEALDKEGIAVRSGHHCAQPILRRFGVESSVRPSLGLYNTREDVDALVDALRRLSSSRGR